MALRGRVRYSCSSCESKVSTDEHFCRACGHPTTWATHEEKVGWELEQYARARRQPIETVAVAPVSAIPPRRSSGGSVIAEAVRKLQRVRPHRDAPDPLANVELPAIDDAALTLKIVRILNAQIDGLERRVAELERSESHTEVVLP